MRTFLAVAALAVGLDAAAQAPIDFSGTWVAEATPAPPPAGSPAAPPGRPDQGALGRGDMGSGWGSPLTITHDAGRLVVEPAVFSRYDATPQPRFVFALDGSETRATVMIGHATQTQTSRAGWDGKVLRIVTQYPGVDPATGAPFSTAVTRRLWLETPATLVIEVTRAAAPGGRDTATRVVYRRN